MRRLITCLSAVLGLAVGGFQPAHPQALAMADRAPRFLLNAPSGHKPVDVNRTAVLRRHIALDLRDVSLGEALQAIERASGLQLGYSRKVVPVDRVVRLVAEDITVAGALSAVLFDTGTDVLFERNGQAAIVRRPVAPFQQTGTIAGTVTDRASNAPIPGAAVTVLGTRQEASAGEDGHYQIDKVPPGTYTVRARYIGYSPATVTVTVEADEQATADFDLVKSVQNLDELVAVTPGGLQVEVRALPSPVTVIRASDLETRRPQTFNDVFRQLVPSAVGFDLPAQPATTVLSLRGANSLAGAGPAKVFVDGVESAFSLSNPVDPESIDRIEVIRGPQAATIYGPDAAGGVVQIFTKRGDADATGPQVTAQLEGGIQQTPYEGFGGVARQAYSAAVRGGTGDATYNLGGTYSRLSDWVPNDDVSRQSIPSVFGGLRYESGSVALDISGRYLVTKSGTALNPLILQTGFLPLSQPRFFDDRATNRTVGAGLAVTATPWWRNRLTVGFDERSDEGTQQRRRLTTPGDSLLTFISSASGRISAGYNAEFAWTAPSGGASATLIAGVDHYRLSLDEASTVEALNVEGTIQVVPGGAFNVSHSVTTNTGYFAQLTVNLRDRLFRHEWLTGRRQLDLRRRHRDPGFSPCRTGLRGSRGSGGAQGPRLVWTIYPGPTTGTCIRIGISNVYHPS